MGKYILAIALATLLTPADALAGDEVTLAYSNLLVGRINPLGAKNDFALHVRRTLVEHDHILLSDTFVSGKLVTSIKPTAVQLGFGAELQPLAILRLSGSVAWVRHLTPFDNLASFPDPDADHSDTDLEKLGDAGENYGAQGVYITLGALLQAKVGPVAVRNQLTFIYAALELERGDRYFYEIEWDLLAENRSFVLMNNTDVLYLADFGLIAGVRYSLSHTFYSERNPNTPVHKIGPILGWTFKEEIERFDKPTVLLMALWYLKHRYRTGRDVSQGLPCIVLAFAFRGDLMTVAPDPD
jgi:hypothetical protein